MSAGTIALTNNSAAVSGTGTSFTTELKAGDFIGVIAGGTPYTLIVAAVTSNTQLTIGAAYTGPTASGLSWYAVPASLMYAVTQQAMNDMGTVLRGMNSQLVNWQKIYSNAASVSVERPDRTQFTGPSWGYLSSQLATKSANQLLTDGSGNNWYASFSSRTDFGMVSHGDTPNIVSPWDAPSKYSMVNYFPSTANNFGTALASSWGSDNEYYLNSKNSAVSGYQGWKGWARIRHSKNTTVDGSGFIKQASPIARLTNDAAQMGADFCEGFILSGSAAVNEEAEGVKARRSGVGSYIVTGALGLASEGWQIEVPKDINGNRLCFVKSEMTDAGNLSIKVFKPKLDLETGGIVAGDAIDIPEGRWIDLRLSMPEDSIYNLRTQKEDAVNKPAA